MDTNHISRNGSILLLSDYIATEKSEESACMSSGGASSYGVASEGGGGHGKEDKVREDADV